MAETAGDAKLLALVKMVVEELTRLHPAVQIAVEGDYVAGSKTVVRDSVVSRSTIGVEAEDREGNPSRAEDEGLAARLERLG